MKKWKRWGANLLVNIPIMLLSLTCIFPVVWLLYSSLKTDVEFARSPISLPAVPNFGNYVTAFQRASFGTFTFNSVFNSIISLVLMLVPIYALIVPLFIQEKKIGILNSRWSLIPVYVAMELPMSVFLIDSYMQGISIDMEEAAAIDGAGLLKTMFIIMMPLCKPILSTVVILTFMHVWNEFAFAQVLISQESLKTIPIGLTYFTSQYMTSYTLLLAALAMATLPVLVIYLFFYNKIMEGMMAGAVKG